jgi:hypothetical protein
MGAAKVGRNQACSCGSGRKFKHCCEAKRQSMSLAMRVALVAAAGALIAGIVLGVSSFDANTGPGAGRVWSEEHGHWH